MTLRSPNSVRPTRPGPIDAVLRPEARAGIDTTWSTIGSSLLHFATHPDDRRRLAAEPELLPSALEEMLRLHSPVYAGRIALEDLDYDGVTIERGERMILNLPAANRDPAAFERPDEAVIDRQKNRHVAFGVGIHRCVGSNLARLEMDVALRTWFTRIPEFELSDPEAVTWSRGSGSRRAHGSGGLLDHFLNWLDHPLPRPATPRVPLLGGWAGERVAG